MVWNEVRVIYMQRELVGGGGGGGGGVENKKEILLTLYCFAKS